MCMDATCPLCSKKSWRGCGLHIPSVLGSVPESEWCTCEPRVDVRGRSFPPAAPLPFFTWLSSNRPAKSKEAEDDSAKEHADL